MIFVKAPAHATGLVGGAAAKVSPATFQLIGHAVALIVNGGRPVSKTGDGSFPPAGDAPLNLRLVGSIANSQAPVASNWRSTARGS